MRETPQLGYVIRSYWEFTQNKVTNNTEPVEGNAKVMVSFVRLERGYAVGSSVHVLLWIPAMRGGFDIIRGNYILQVNLFLEGV